MDSKGEKTAGASQKDGEAPKTSQKTEKPPKGSQNDKEPEPPSRNFFPAAVVHFMSGGQVIALGNTNHKSQGHDVKVSFTMKHRGLDKPYLGFIIELKRKTSQLYRHSEYHTVLFKYHQNEFSIEHHTADAREKAQFLSIMLNDAPAKEAVENDKLYVIKLSSTGSRAPEVTGYGSSFVGANENINNTYNHLSSVTSSRYVTLWLFQTQHLAYHVEWILNHMKETPDSLLPYYHPSKKTPVPQPHVQWGMLRPIPDDYTKPFEPRASYKDFGEFGVMNGNAEAYNAQNAFTLAKELRNIQVSIAVFRPASSKGDFYWIGLTMQDFEKYGQLFQEKDSVYICNEPAPKQTEGEKLVKDLCPAWKAIVLSDDYNLMNADVALLLQRPRDSEHALHNMKIKAASSLDEELPIRYVYLRLVLDSNTVKGRLNALEKHRYRHRPDADFENKRRILVGRDLSVTSTVDMLKDLSNERVDEIASDLNDVQRECFTAYCRKLPNGIGLIHGPGGTGKTLLVAKLAESVAEQGRNVLIVTSQNSAADSDIEKLVNSEYMVVRAHSLGLERKTMIRSLSSNTNDETKRQIEDTQSNFEDDDVADSDMRDAEMRVTTEFMQLCEQVYTDKDSILRPTDPRMQKVHFAIHTWVLKIAGILPSKWGKQPNEEQVKAGAIDEWSTFRDLYAKNKLGRLEDQDWLAFKEHFGRLAMEVIHRAHIIACTPAVATSDLLKGKTFGDVLNDETSVTTSLELLCAWRQIENLVLIGDDFQLKPPVFTGSQENPFYKMMEYSTFARFRDLDMPAFLLTDQMRMPAGMMHLSNSIIYGGKLRDGVGTALSDLSKAKDLKTFYAATYPSLQPEPEELIYPVMVNVHGESAREGKGTSVFNAYNVAATLEEIVKLITRHPHANSSNVGIATPYRAQIRLYKRALAKASGQHPELNLRMIRVGTAEFWQGDELAYVFVDLVRASNDVGVLGFVSDARRLNVLITRQTVGLWIVADERMVLGYAAQQARDNPIGESSAAGADGQVSGAAGNSKVQKSQEDQRNTTVIAMFAWMREKGRVVNVAKESLTEKYVDFPRPEENKEEQLGGWPEPTTDAKEVVVDDSHSEKHRTAPTFDDNKEKVPQEWNETVNDSLWEDGQGEGGQEEGGEEWNNWGY